MEFTAAIPTFNGASGYLSKVLDALLKQKQKVVILNKLYNTS
jgi:glycosyltransferase involved in cell wall biosynthesis